MAFSGDPVGEGFAAGLARPGGNITGHSAAVAEMSAKRVEFLKSIVPKLSHVALLTPVDGVRAIVSGTEAAARSLGLQVSTTLVRNPSDVDHAFSSMPGAHVGGVIVDLALRQHQKQILALALKSRLPTISGPREFVEAGGLVAYGPNFPDLFRRSAAYVDKILKGARPADLPIEQPTKFDLVVNLKTAKALGLTVPRTVILQADQVIE
jgi:putative ABC transport system substrate-binding protein